MIAKMSHVSIFVLDQEEAKKFYTEKLGFVVKMDQKMDNGFRWLTVSPVEQPDLEIILMGIAPGPMMDEKSSLQLKELVKSGKLGAGAFMTGNCQKTYEELKTKGVEFFYPPKQQFYGIETLFKDNSGNWFSLTQPA
ncbi:MAG: VOC family protein [Ignavibacteriaceae bacterium]